MSSFQGVGYESVSYVLKNYQVMSESINGKVQVRNIGASRYQWSVSFPMMTRSEFDPLWTFIQAQQGMKNVFEMSLPNPKVPNQYKSYEVRLAEPEQEFEIGVDSLISFSMDVIEVL
jgi:hypothetical protein